MLAGLEEQVKMLSEAARFLREDFKPVFHSVSRLIQSILSFMQV